MRWNQLCRNGCTAALAAAAVATSPEPAGAQQAAGLEDWHFSVTPYVWMAALKGDLGTLSGLPAVEVDASFGDILDHTDLTLMVALEARYQRFGVLTDIVYLALSGDGDTPGLLFSDAEVDVSNAFFTIGGFYRVVETNTFHADLIPGMRVWSADTELELDAGLLAGRRDTDDETWVDPLIAARGSAALFRNFSVSAYADIGGFGSASELTWQLAGTLDWQALDWLVARAGYRHLDVDYEHGGFVFDVYMTGPVIGAALRF
jgi:hypothetical protein